MGGPKPAVDLDAECIVDRFYGPASVLDSTCAALAANPAWQALDLADSEGRGDMPAEVAAAVLASCATGTPQRIATQLRRGEAGETHSYEFTMLPARIESGPCVLVLGDDRDMRDALSEALVESRAFHRDLAQCANDAIWQVDASGRIGYVGEGGMLGYSQVELCGTLVGDLVADRSKNGGALVFASREPIFDAELWLRHRSDEERCMLISAVPIFTADGEWAGLRGIGRDVTEERVRQAELAQMRRSQRLVDSVLHAMRSEARPEHMLQAVASVVIDTVGLAGCLVLMTPDGGFATSEITANCYESEALSDGFRQHVGALTELCRACAAEPEAVTAKAQIEEWNVLIALTRYGARLNGAVVFLRLGEASDRADGEAWSDDDRILLRAMCEQTGVTTEQLQMYRDRRRRAS